MTLTPARAEPGGATRPAGRVVGLAAAAALGLTATAIGWACPQVGAPVVAVAGGALLSGRLRRWAPRLAPGLAFARNRVLQLSVVLLGAQLSLGEMAQVGASSLPVMLGTLTVCLLLAWAVGRRLGIGRDLRTLIGVGTAICGASAIAAVSPAIRARSCDVAYAISTIFAFNIVAVLVLPPFGHALGLSQAEFGLFAGTAVNDTSSVVAAATSYGDAAAQHAVVVKLTRSLMIVPVVLVLGALARRREGGAPRPTGRVRQVASLVPWFLVGFVAVVALNSAGALPAGAVHPLALVAQACIAVALAAIGLSTDVRALRAAGLRPLLLGFVLWLAVTGTSLGLQALTG